MPSFAHCIVPPLFAPPPPPFPRWPLGKGAGCEPVAFTSCPISVVSGTRRGIETVTSHGFGAFGFVSTPEPKPCLATVFGWFRVFPKMEWQQGAETETEAAASRGFGFGSASSLEHQK